MTYEEQVTAGVDAARKRRRGKAPRLGFEQREEARRRRADGEKIGSLAIDFEMSDAGMSYVCRGVVPAREAPPPWAATVVARAREAFGLDPREGWSPRRGRPTLAERRARMVAALALHQLRCTALHRAVGWSSPGVATRRLDRARSIREVVAAAARLTAEMKSAAAPAAPPLQAAC